MSSTETLDTSTATHRLMLAVIGAVGQAEWEAMLERQREGIAKAQREAAIKVVRRLLGGRLPEIVRLKSEGVRPSEIVVRPS